MSTANPEFLAFLAQQRADYGRSLPPRLLQIAALWQQVLNHDAASADALAGSAATFGFAALGEAARVLELLVQPLAASAQALTPQARSELGRAVEALQRSLPGAC